MNKQALFPKYGTIPSNYEGVFLFANDMCAVNINLDFSMARLCQTVDAASCSVNTELNLLW